MHAKVEPRNVCNAKENAKLAPRGHDERKILNSKSKKQIGENEMTKDNRKVAFVTGGSSGIGRATAEAFIAEGYQTVVVDRDETAGITLVRKLGGESNCSFFDCDVADDDAVKRAVEFTISKYGRLDAAFNGAGTDGDMGKAMADYSMEQFQRVMAVNVSGVWSCMRHQIRAMLNNGGGAIVNASSTAGLVAFPFMSAYVASKHAVVGLTRTAAVEYARLGIRVNAVCPGVVDTPMIRHRLRNEMVEALAEATPIGRIGKPEEIASTVVWLCGSTAPYLTGQAIAVDGGWTSR
jgi:NAD(P)-dependent dehydrogenase (short-subunit alcohol dehydrogenase family)